LCMAIGIAHWLLCDAAQGVLGFEHDGHDMGISSLKSS
jgi:hypothetical protein